MAAREPLPDIMGEALGRLRLAKPEPEPCRPKVVPMNPAEPELPDIFSEAGVDDHDWPEPEPSASVVHVDLEAPAGQREHGGPARLTVRHELDLDPGELWSAILSSRLGPVARRDLDELWLLLRELLRELNEPDDLDKWQALEAAIAAALEDLRMNGEHSLVLAEASRDRD